WSPVATSTVTFSRGTLAASRVRTSAGKKRPFGTGRVMSQTRMHAERLPRASSASAGPPTGSASARSMAAAGSGQGGMARFSITVGPQPAGGETARVPRPYKSSMGPRARLTAALYPAPAALEIDAALLGGAVARASHRTRREDLLEGGEGGGRRRQARRGGVLVEPARLARAGGRHDARTPAGEPGQGELGRGRAELGGQGAEGLDEGQVVADVLGLEPGHVPAQVGGAEARGVGDGPGEEAPAERAVGHEADAELVAEVEQRV